MASVAFMLTLLCTHVQIVGIIEVAVSLVMATGLSVEFTAYITLAFISAEHTSRNANASFEGEFKVCVQQGSVHHHAANSQIQMDGWMDV